MTAAASTLTAHNQQTPPVGQRKARPPAPSTVRVAADTATGVKPETVETIAADLIALLFSEGLMARGRTLAEVCIAAGVPLRSLRQAQQRLQDGFTWSPAAYRPRRGSPASQMDRRKPNRVIPEDATEWVCRSDGCHAKGRPQPISEFPRRADVGSRRTTCNTCRRRYQQDRYLTVEKTRRLGQLPRFVVAEGDACVGIDCPGCRRPLRVGEEVCAADVTIRHSGCWSEAGTPDMSPGGESE